MRDKAKVTGWACCLLSICGGLMWLVATAVASSPNGHVVFSEAYLNSIKNKPDHPLHKIANDPELRRAFIAGSVSPDLASIEDPAHSQNPKETAQKLMKTAQNRLANAKTDAEKRSAEKDMAFANGWLSHGAADLATHPEVNKSGKNYWEDSTIGDKATHAEWETMQEKNWMDEKGEPTVWVGAEPKDPKQPGTDGKADKKRDYLGIDDYRPDLLKDAFGIDRGQVEKDVGILNTKSEAANLVKIGYSDEKKKQWAEVNNHIAKDGMKLADEMLTHPENLDNSSWSVGQGITDQDMKDFVEDTKKKNTVSPGNLPTGFFDNYWDTITQWKDSGKKDTPKGPPEKTITETATEAVTDMLPPWLGGGKKTDAPAGGTPGTPPGTTPSGTPKGGDKPASGTPNLGGVTSGALTSPTSPTSPGLPNPDDPPAGNASETAPALDKLR